MSRFLAVESCGQCTPCKQDGLAIAEMLRRICEGEGNNYDLAGVADRVTTVADEARCFLAQQHQRVVDSILRLVPDDFRRHVDLTVPAPATVPETIVPITNLTGDGETAELDVDHLTTQPDWTHNPNDSGQVPAERLARRAE